MLRAAVLALVVGCTGTPDSDLNDDVLPDDIVDVETGDVPQDEPETIDGVPVFQLPFPCDQVWSGQTRTNHSPSASVDFNRADDFRDDVVAAARGFITRVENTGATSYGRWIEIEHGGGYRTRYAHLDTQLVAVDQPVLRGQKIGTLGNTGGSSGPHLHYEQRKAGVAVPAKFDNVEAVYYATRDYTSANACTVDAVAGRVHSEGMLAIRTSTSVTSASIGSVADGAIVAITCQKLGESVTGTFGTSALWDKIGSGYVPDAFVATGSDQQVAPLCP
jgi:hypothetical protein